MARSWWQPWRWFKSRHLSGVRIVVYTRQNCPLCQEAETLLQREQERLGFHLQWVNVDQNQALKALHGDWVPVVEINGEVRFRGQINSVLWQRLMQALARR
jgi:glutaredoxin